MSKTQDFDVIIIGSGVAGLVCGCYLQKAGLKVAIFENREEAGGGRMAHEALRPGYLIQSCIWGDLEPVMPYQLDLELDRYGYQDTHMMAEWGWGYVNEDDECLVNNCWNPLKTAEKVRRFSHKDADKVLEIAQHMAAPYDEHSSRSLKFFELFFLEPWTWENFDTWLNLMAPLFPVSDPYDLTDINAFEALDMIYESEQLKLFCASNAMGGTIYPQHTGGAGPLAAILPINLFYSHPRHSCHSLAHVYIRCFRALGGKLFNSCPVKKIIVAGGEAKGVVLDDDAAFPGKEITAPKVVTNVNPRVTFTQLVDEEHLEKQMIRQLKTNWKVENVLVQISYALKERPLFAAEKFDPDIRQSLTGMFGPNTMKELMSEWGLRIGGRIPEHSAVTYLLPHIDDPTQNMPGNAVAQTCVEVPYALYERGGAQIWDDKDFRDSLVKMVLERVEARMPGFKDNMLGYWMTTPLDHERINPNYLHGCMTGGSITQHHMFYANRATGMDGFDKGGIVTPIKNLYGSGSTGPAWSTGGNGYRTAGHIAQELGIRKNQTWWKHRPFDYLAKKYIEKTYVPLKTSSILDR